MLGEKKKVYLSEKYKWAKRFSYLLSLLIALLSIELCTIRGFDGMTNENTFTIGADIVSMGVCTVLLYSISRNADDMSEHNRVFGSLIMWMIGVLFSDLCCWIVQGIPELRIWNLTANILNYTATSMICFAFWRFIVTYLDLNGKIMNKVNVVMNVCLVLTIISILLNIFFPLYFSVDENGVYRREAYFIFSQTYTGIGLIFIVIGLFVSKTPVRSRLVIASFLLIPVAAIIITNYKFGMTAEFPAMLVSIVLIYGVVISDREKGFAATRNELYMASAIQSGILPSVFPPFPDREEFEIYAYMKPAKEIGGDFYDFFFTDEDHLVTVIADVSGKGVPAALFMMSSKILIYDIAMTSEKPSEILRIMNDRICANNTLELFVTVWLGILEISTGKLICANAGHEFPVLGRGKSFELYKDKHGFVIGGMPDMVYKDYEIELEEGDSIFVYTDGVVEATNAANELFGTNRMTEAMNGVLNGVSTVSEISPNRIIEGVHDSVKDFVGDSSQFDDLTMLCLKYKGKNKKM